MSTPQDSRPHNAEPVGRTSATQQTSEQYALVPISASDSSSITTIAPINSSSSDTGLNSDTICTIPPTESTEDQPATTASTYTPVNDVTRPAETGPESNTTFKFTALGPLVINSDGTLSRISNWGTLTEGERERTLRILGKRNQLRKERILGDEDNGTEGKSGASKQTNDTT